MRTYGVTVVAIVSLIAGIHSPSAAGDAREEAVARDLRTFKGTWRLSYKEVDGKKFSEEEIKDLIGTVDGSGKVTVRRGDKVVGAGTIKLDPTRKPKAIDVTFTEGDRKGTTALGIYEIDSDVFRVCLPRAGDERPDDFSARAGSGRTLIVYKREKQ
jgi:uncharacterized protein (TIGR03067 family)